MTPAPSSRRRVLVVGTRGSALAVAQTGIVCDALRRIESSLEIRVETITTTGDIRADIPISQLGRGVFVTEIEQALRERRIDFAVHSAKDLPSTLAADLTIAAFLRRADARDVLVSRAGTLRELPRGARVGTSSPRRTCQLRALRPDLDLRDVRGNVDTRLRKLAVGDFDALVLAGAGLIRLGRAAEATEWLDVETAIPCVGQGALAAEARADDERTVMLLGRLDDARTRAAVSAERAFLAELGAGCDAAVAAHASVDQTGRLHIAAMIGAIDGRCMMLRRGGDVRDAEYLGSAVARELLRDGAATFLTRDGSALAGVRIAVTRAAGQCADLIALLQTRGAKPVACPTIAIEPLHDFTELDASLRDLAAMDWIVFTSASAVRAVADRLSRTRVQVPVSVRLAAVGSATAGAIASAIGPVAFVSTSANAEALGAQLPDVHGRGICLPLGNLAGDTLADQLRTRGARVRSAVAYRTVAGAGVADLEQMTASGQLDAIVFASPSSVRFAAKALSRANTAAERSTLIVCIGPSTASAATKHGLPPDAVATTQSVGGIVETLERLFAVRRRTPDPVEV